MIAPKLQWIKGIKPAKRRRGKPMTICIGVLAADAKSIVCVADKAVTYTGTEEIVGDTDSTKIVGVGSNGAHAMISGGEDAISRVLAKLNLCADLGLDREKSKACCEIAYRDAESEILEMKFLRPFLTIDEYRKALTADRVNHIIRSIADDIKKAREESQQMVFSCSLLLCGFDSKHEPYLLSLDSPGACTDMTLTGFCATGSGSGYALQRMLSNEWQRSYPIDRALYEVFDAKASAENDPNVGYDWDAVILTADRSESVPREIKKIVDRAWVDEARSPYDVFDEEEDLPKPPPDWMSQLKKYAESVLPPNPPTHKE